MAKEKFDHVRVEQKWQKKWQEENLYRSTEDPEKEKTYVLDMFPYPSGEGLHVGHPKGYIATDIYSRHMRMRGRSVLHPMGWDAFGLPAENFALKNKVHPRVAVEKNIAHFKQQLAHIGFDYDWSREINTTDPAYYHWTQWIFLKMFENGLAFQSDEPINWCPSCMTGLANEDLDRDVCERCGTPVEKKKLPQWVLKITEYADRLLADLDSLDWPEHIKEAQRNWIGRSEGAEIEFGIKNKELGIKVFTTRPDTIFGATYVVLAPEHPLMQNKELRIKNNEEVRTYIEVAAKKTERERGENKEKTGVKLEGVSAINPATKEEIPIFVADYVLGSYGTGAVMAVPAHDERDFEFAQKFNLPIKQVVVAPFIQTTEPGRFREDEPAIVTNGIIALVKHWSEDKYIGLKWKKVAWGTLLTGSVEDGLSPEETVLKEIKEETGYLHPKIIRKLGIVDGLFYHVPKQKNLRARGHIFLVELTDGTSEPIADEENEKHEIKWLTLDEMPEFFTADTHQYALKLLRDGYAPYTGSGSLVDSGEFSGKNSDEAKWDIVNFVRGKKATRYKIRDWVFSRQRYWGEPIPIIHCEKCGAMPVPYEDLPVVLPEVEFYEPTGTGESPLAAIEEWVNVTCPKCGGPAKRETNTMPQWAGSSWYYLRFMDPHNDEQLVSTKKEKYWAPVNVYVGGDHAVRHLIYARFWHKFLYDIGVVSTSEPFARLEFLGFILAEDGRKMSKRFGNVINPDDVVAEYGADAFRIYEMFMGPFENTTAWSTASITGTARFVERIWQAQELVREESVSALDTPLHQTIRKVGMDIESFKFNTAISQLMIFLNMVEHEGTIGAEQWKMFLRLLAPFAPHIAEELWAKLSEGKSPDASSDEASREKFGEEGSVHQQPWPAFDEKCAAENQNEIVVQINGKRRGSIMFAVDTSEDAVVAEALKLPAVVKVLDGREPKRVVFVPNKIINFVV
jgi:leucyl-tRNA synthetase